LELNIEKIILAISDKIKVSSGAEKEEFNRNLNAL